MYEAIEMHVRGLVEDGLPVPESSSFAEYIALPLAASSNGESLAEGTGKLAFVSFWPGADADSR
jgi:hypothetical protein